MLFKKLRDREKELNDRFERNEKRISNLSDKIDTMERILRNYVPGKITGVNEFIHHWPAAYDSFYVYKDGKEFCFRGLSVIDPVFENTDIENVVYVTSQKNGEKYILDLRTLNGIALREAKASDGSGGESNES